MVKANADGTRALERFDVSAVRDVQFELSNRCGYDHMHPRCPAHQAGAPRTLETPIVLAVLEYLGIRGFKGEVMFSIYNEPTTDPRLFTLLEATARLCAGSNVYMITNGWNLDAVMFNELRAAGVRRMIVNAYTESERVRLEALQDEMGWFKIRGGHLDNRTAMYERETQDLNEPCKAPFGSLVVWHTGEVGICCHDWRRSVTFGDLHETGIDDILHSPEMLAAHNDLCEGKRTADVCRRCLKVPKGAR